MKRVKFQMGVIGIILASLLALVPPVGIRAETISDSPDITIHRFKVVTGDQFIELKNNTDSPLPVSDLQLVYYNNYDLSVATTSKIITLSGEIPAGGYYLITDGTQFLCYQSAVASASLGFATGSGQVQLVRWQQSPGQPFGFRTLDAVSWHRKSSASAPNPPAGVVLFQSASQNPGEFALRSWKDADGNELAKAPAGGSWQTARLTSGCGYEVIGAEEEALEDEAFSFLTGAMPPVRYVSAASSRSGPINRNVGKAAPIINEVLPNPASPQTDADDEFIELYNPNDSSFDLTDFRLAFGSTNPKKYTFPEGTVLQPKEFRAFTSGDTSISLSNTQAQVWLLDPNEQVVGQADPYKNAKDGQAWALDAGKWVWSLQPTPGAMNAIALPVTDAAKGKTAAAVLGISGTTGTTNAGEPSSGSAAAELDDAAPLHPLVLAVVGAAAVGYMLYEYRGDMSNRIFQFRRYLRNRQALRRQV